MFMVKLSLFFAAGNSGGSVDSISLLSLFGNLNSIGNGGTDIFGATTSFGSSNAIFNTGSTSLGSYNGFNFAMDSGTHYTIIIVIIFKELQF